MNIGANVRFSTNEGYEGFGVSGNVNTASDAGGWGGFGGFELNLDKRGQFQSLSFNAGITYMQGMQNPSEAYDSLRFIRSGGGITGVITPGADGRANIDIRGMVVGDYRAGAQKKAIEWVEKNAERMRQEMTIQYARATQLKQEMAEEEMRKMSPTTPPAPSGQRGYIPVTTEEQRRYFEDTYKVWQWNEKVERESELIFKAQKIKELYDKRRNLENEIRMGGASSGIANEFRYLVESIKIEELSLAKDYKELYNVDIVFIEHGDLNYDGNSPYMSDIVINDVVYLNAGSTYPNPYVPGHPERLAPDYYGQVSQGMYSYRVIYDPQRGGKSLLIEEGRAVSSDWPNSNHGGKMIVTEVMVHRGYPDSSPGLDGWRGSAGCLTVKPSMYNEVLYSNDYLPVGKTGKLQIIRLR